MSECMHAGFDWKFFTRIIALLLERRGSEILSNFNHHTSFEGPPSANKQKSVYCPASCSQHETKCVIFTPLKEYDFKNSTYVHIFEGTPFLLSSIIMIFAARAFGGISVLLRRRHLFWHCWKSHLECNFSAKDWPNPAEITRSVKKQGLDYFCSTSNRRACKGIFFDSKKKIASSVASFDWINPTFKHGNSQLFKSLT